MKQKKVWGLQAHTAAGNLRSILRLAKRVAREEGDTYELWCNHGTKHIRTLVVNEFGDVTEWSLKHPNVFKRHR